MKDRIRTESFIYKLLHISNIKLEIVNKKLRIVNIGGNLHERKKEDAAG
jgi:hypothetical protein